LNRRIGSLLIAFTTRFAAPVVVVLAATVVVVLAAAVVVVSPAVVVVSPAVVVVLSPPHALSREEEPATPTAASAASIDPFVMNVRRETVRSVIALRASAPRSSLPGSSWSMTFPLWNWRRTLMPSTLSLHAACSQALVNSPFDVYAACKRKETE
jgi:hypothetical protein